MINLNLNKLDVLCWIKGEEKKLMTHEISWETQPHSHISPSIMIKVTRFLKPHHMIRLQTLWTFVFLFFLLSQQPPPLSTSVISSTVFKQTTVSFHHFSTNKEEAEADGDGDADTDVDAYAEVRSRFVAFLP